MRTEKAQTIPVWLPLLIDGCHVELFFSTGDVSENCDETKANAIEQALMVTYKKEYDVVENIQ